jgi:hypothetical protein
MMAHLTQPTRIGATREARNALLPCDTILPSRLPTPSHVVSIQPPYDVGTRCVVMLSRRPQGQKLWLSEGRKTLGYACSADDVEH